MPELPEVQTTVDGLRKKVVGLTIADVWTDLSSAHAMYADSIKNALYFKNFRKAVVGQKIISAERRAKNILINLSNKQTILIHMKMTGHLLYGKYRYDPSPTLPLVRGGRRVGSWIPTEKGPLHDPFNRFLHFVISFTNSKQLVLSDMRKFAKVVLLSTGAAHEKHLGGIGPEPLEKSFDLKKFKACLARKPGGKIKQVLMDQSVIAGIGNIYSDEMLWLAGIHPLSQTGKIPSSALRTLFTAMKSTLKKGIDFGGDSTSDYRQLDGTPGTFSHAHNAYRMTGKPCEKKGCSGAILRMVVGGRSAHFCPQHQKRS